MESELRIKAAYLAAGVKQVEICCNYGGDTTVDAFIENFYDADVCIGLPLMFELFDYSALRIALQECTERDWPIAP